MSSLVRLLSRVFSSSRIVSEPASKPFFAHPQRGNVFAMLFAAVALTGVLASVGMQTLTGPVTTITRVTQKNIADTQLLMNAKIIINAAVSGTLGGDADNDGIIEPAPFGTVGGTAPTNGGFLPTTLGLSLTDPWGSMYGYCVWDHGTTNSSTNRITGDNTASANTQPVIAIIAAGPDKQFQTSCAAYTSGPIVVAKTGGSDDLIFKYTYAEASANSNGLWTLNTSNQAKAELKDSGGTARVSIDRSTGIGDFLGITTDTLAAKTDRIAVDGGLKLDTNTNVTACAAADAGVIRYNTTTLKLEICTGTVWKAAGSDLWLENGTHIYNGNTGNVGIGTSSPSQKLDVQGNTNISGNTVVGGTGSVAGNFTVNTDAFSVIAASKYVGIGKAVPTVALDVVGNAYVTGTGTIVDDLIVDTTSLFVDASANTVGIGTATPTYALDVYAVKTIGPLGTLDTNNAIVRISEDTTGPSLFMDGNTVVSDQGFIMGSTGNYDVSVVANAAEVIRATASGNVGIGTGSPAVKLDIAGTARVTDGSSLQFGGTDTAITGSSSTDLLTISTAGAERMRVTATGLVGIGDTSPSARLSVAGGVKIAGHSTCGAGENGTIRYDSTLKIMQLCVDGNWKSVSSIDKLDDIGDVDAPTPAGNEVLAWDTVSGKWMAKPISALGPASVTPAGNDGSIQFKDGSNLGADPTTFHWDKTNDRLGVGTNSPDTDVHIKRAAGNTVLKIESGSGFGTISHTGANLAITNSATAGDTDIYTADELSFWTGTPSTRRFYIDATGKTGIGTATPGALLDVEGGIQLGDDTGTCNVAKEGTLRFNTSQLQICVAGTWAPVGSGSGGGGGLGTTMVSGWPDAINCGAVGNPSMYYLTYAPYSDNKFYYRNIWHGSELSVIFLNDKSYDSKTTGDTGCDSKGIGQLYAELRAFNFVGGGTAGAGTSMVTNVPDAIECGVSGTKRVLFLQTTTATTYTYALSGGANAVGMQVVYNALPAGTHNATTNTAGWTNANGCDGKPLAQLASESRTFNLVGGGSGGGSGLTVAGSDGYIQFNSSGALDGEPALFWSKANNYLGVGLSGAPLATIDVAGGVKLGTDATCSAAKAGMLVYNAGTLQFCNSSGSFVPVATGAISLANGAAGRVQLSDGSGNFTSDAGLTFTSGTLAASGNATVGGTLGVTGAATIGGTLAASNNATVGGTLGVTGNTTVGGTLDVTGAATLSSATVTGNLTVDTNTLLVDATGNRVGIGVSSPVAMLEVGGGLRIGNDSGTCDGTRVGTLRFVSDNLEVCKVAGWSPTGGGGGGTLWTVAGNDAYSTNTGNLGVGTTTPQAKLDVAGGIRLGDDTTTCTANNNGTLRFNTGKMQICVNLEWTDLAVVSGTAPIPPDEEQPFTLIWPDAIMCSNGTETRYFYANSNLAVATTRNYREPEGNTVFAFDNTGRFMTGGFAGTNCHSKTMTQLITDGQTFNFKSGTASTMRSGYPDVILCPRNSPTTTKYFMYLTTATGTNIRYRDFNSNEYLDINPATNTAGSVQGQCYDSYWGGYYACAVGSRCDNDTVAQLYAGANGEKAYDIVGGDSTKTYESLLPDNIVCRDGNGDQYALYRSYTDASIVRYQNPNQTNQWYVDFNPTSRAPTAENLNGTPDCYQNLDVLRTQNKAFNFADNGGVVIGSGSSENNPVITQPAPGSGNSMVSGWPDILVCNQAGGQSIVLRYNLWRTDNLHAYFSSHSGYAAYFNDNGTWNTHASLGSTDCMNASMSQLIASGRTRNFRDAGASTSILPGWPDQILCTRNSDGVIFPMFIGLVDATTYRYYHQGGTSSSLIFNRSGTFSSDALGTDCANKTIGQLMAEPSRTFNLHRGVDDGSVIPSVPDGLICTNDYGKKRVYWIDNLYQDNTPNGLAYRSNGTNYIGFNTVKPYTFNTESVATSDCRGKSIAQLHKEGATIFLADTNNIGSVPAPYTPTGGSKIDGWPDMVLCHNNDNYPYLFHVAYQDATLTYYRTTAGTTLNFNRNQTFSSIGVGNTTCQNQSIAQLTTLGATFNYGGGGGAGGAGGLPAGSDGQVQFRNNGAFAASSNFFWNNTTSRLGLGTTSPAVRLDVAGGVKIGNEVATCAAGVAGTLRWNGTALQVCDGTAWSAIGSGGSGTPGGTSGQLQFNSAGTFDGTNNMVWDNANTRLGINTATPTANIHVVNSTANHALIIDETPSGVGESHIVLRNATGSQFLSIAGASAVSSFNPLTQAGDSRVIFSNAGVAESGGLVIGPWSATAKGIRLDGATGNVGIGTAAPVATLDVAGGVRIGNSTTCAGGGANNGTLRFDPVTKNLQLCVDGAYSNVGGSSGGGAGTTMTGGWPDALVCNFTSPAWNQVTLLPYQSPAPDGTFYYVTTISASYWIRWNANGTYNTNSNVGASNCLNRSIGQLYASGQAYNFVGGGGTSGGASGTNASMYSGWPDAIQCVNGTTDRRTLMFANRNETTGDVVYRQTINSADNSITFNSSGAVSANSNMASYDCVANASFDTITELYSQSRAFNLAASTAIASGTAGSVQFSGGANLLSDTSNFFWDNTNKRLGIGTGSPAMQLSVGAVAASATVAGFRGASNNQINIAHSGNGGWGLLLSNSNSAVLNTNYHQTTSANNTPVALVNVSNDAMHFGTNNTRRMTLDHNGNLGIGTITPQAMLEVTGGVKVGTDTTCNASKYGMLSWNAGTTLQVCTSAGMINLATASGISVTAAGTNGQVQFNNSGALGASTSLFWDNTNSLLGIGTSTPGHELQIQDTDTTAYTPTAYNASRHKIMLRAGNADQSAVLMRFSNHGGMENSFGVVQQGASGQGDFIFQSWNGSAYGERMRIRAAGNVGIGTAAPSSPLDIVMNSTSGEQLRLDSTSASEGGQITLMDGTGVGGWEIDNAGGAGAEEFRIFRDKAGENVTAGVALTIRNTGFTGISNNNPQAMLDVAGGIRIGTTSTCVAGNAGTLRWTGSAIEVCNGGSWISVGSGGGGTGGTVFAGFPDLLVCTYTSTADVMTMQLNFRYSDGRVYYVYPGAPGSYYLIYNANGTLNTHVNMAASGAGASGSCHDRTIAQIQSLGRAFNFVGGGGTSGGSQGTNQSMVSGAPDAIRCDVSNQGDRVFYLGGALSATGNYVYREIEGGTSDLRVVFNASGTVTTFGYASETSTNCAVGQTFANLYSSGRAFNLAASTAIGAGAAGALQFNGTNNLQADGANLFWDNTNKRLGIGTNSPTARLQVSGAESATANNLLITADSSNNFRWAMGTVSSPSFYNYLSSWNGIDMSFRVANGATEAMRITNSGLIGLSTSTPQARLDVNGGVRVGADATCNASKAGMLSWNSGTTLQICTNTGSFVTLATATGVSAAAAGANGQVQFNNSGALGASTSLFWDNTNSRMAIGTSSANAHRLLVQGNTTTVYANATPDLTLGSVLGVANVTASELANSQAQIQFNVNGGTHNRVGSIGMISEANNNRLSSLVFTTDDGGTRTEKMRITSAGNVGIGTTAPLHKLHVYEAGSGSSTIQIGQIGTSTTANSQLNLVTLAGGANSLGMAGARGWQILGRSNAYVATQQQNDLMFYYWNGSTWTHSVSMDVTGSVGIGTDSPQATLDVNGGIRVGNTSTCAVGNAGTLRWTGSAIEVCNGGSWISVGSGGGGSGTTMAAGFPDAIYCSYNATEFAWAYLMYRYADGRMYYQYPPSTSYYVIFNANGTYNTHAGFLNGGGMNCTNRSISTLYSEGKAYNFVGGGGTSGGSTGTNASITTGAPDAIICPRTDSGENVFYLINTNLSGDVLYGVQSTDWTIRFNRTTGLFSTSAGTGISTWISAASGHCLNTGTTLASLYSSGRAFNLAASTALASGTAGAMQFSGGSNLLSDVSNLFWDNTNKRLGIGTNSPSSPLHIRYNPTSANPADAAIRLANTTNSNFGYIMADNNGFTRIAGGAGTGVALGHHNGTTFTETLRVIGATVGINTLTPVAAFDVNGGVRVGSDTTCNASKAGMLSWNSGTTLQICTNTGAFVNLATASGLAAAVGAVGEVQFNNSNGAFMADSNFFWDNTNKRLGLGSNTPQARLMVRAAQSTTLTNYTAALGSAGILIDNDYAANAYTPGVFWRTSTDNPTMPKAGIYLQVTGSGSIMRFATSNNYATGLTSHVTIDQNGNLTATSVFHTSDARLKDKVETTKGLEVIRKLRGVSFVWKQTGVEALGFIAQEVEGVLPMAVKTDANGMKSVDYNMMIAPLVEAMKELDGEVTVLKAENAALKARVESLEGTVKSLEERLKAIEEKLGATIH